MNRTNRFALLAAVVLLLVLAGTTLANRAPVADEGSPRHATDPEAVEPEAVQHAAERLAANEIQISNELLTELATEYGVGGAVRIAAWSADPDDDVDVQGIRDMRAAGKGWGVIARELGVHPGIGSVMGNGGGHGRENAPGQQKDSAGDD